MQAPRNLRHRVMGRVALAMSAVVLSLAGVVTTSFSDVASALTIATSTLPGAEIGAAYSAKLTTSDGTAPFAWSIGAGALPAGLTLSAAGTLAGAPRTTGTFTFSISVADATQASQNALYSLTVGTGPVIVTASLPIAVKGVDYSTALTATGGTAPYRWSIASGPVPGGFLFTTSGILSGRTATATTFAMSFRVIDAIGGVSTKTLQFSSGAPPAPPQAVAVTTSTGSVSIFSSTSTGAVVANPVATDVVGIAAAGTTGGYWLALSNGEITGVAGAQSFGGIGLKRHVKLAGIAALPNGSGYLVVSTKGVVYGFGKAHSRGSLHGASDAGKVIGIAMTRNGAGYWIVTSRGKVFNFGNARQFGSLGRTGHSAVVAVAASPTGTGLWLANQKGTIYVRGQAKHYAPIGGLTVDAPVTGIAPSPDGKGYWLVERTGTVIAYGSALPIAPPVLLGSTIGVSSAA